jgi:hypothetical protein
MSLPDQVKVTYSEGYDFGIGVNFASGGPRNKAVTGAVTAVEGAPGSTVRFQVKRIKTTSEMEQTLGISAEADYGVPAFSAGASIRFAFAQSAKVQSSSLVLLVTATIKKAFEQIDEPTLNGPAAELADNPGKFAERFGNMFVRGVTSGGLFVGYLRIDTGSAELSNSISAELSGSYGLFSAEAEVNFKKVQREYRSELSIDMYHEGGPPDLHINTFEDPIELLRNVNLFLSSFAERPNEVSVPYTVTFAPLAIANGPLPPNEIDLQNAQDVLIFCAKRRSVLTDQLNTFQYIADNPARFDFSNGADLAKIRHSVETVQSDLDLIARCASRAMNNPKSAKLPEEFATSIGEDYPKTVVPEILPTPKPIQPAQIPVAPNAMPNFVGKPVSPVLSLLGCVTLENVDHCLGFLGNQLSGLGAEARPLADFFFLVTRGGAKFDVRGNPGLPGATIRAQFPAAGVEVKSGTVVTFDI